MKIAYLLAHDRLGPTDLTVGLALEMAGRPDVEVVIVGPPITSSAGDASALVQIAEVRSKTDVRGAMAVRRILRDWAPDVIHAQDRRSGLVAATVARTGAPIVHTYHAVQDDATSLVVTTGPLAQRQLTWRARLVLLADRFVATAVRHTVTPSESLRRFLTGQLRVSESRVRAIPNGVARGPVRTQPVVARTFITVGSFAPAKNVGALLRAFARLHDAMPETRLILVGGADVEEHARCRQLASQLGLDQHAEFTGHVTDVSEHLARADAFVLPSLTETLPMALLQAMGAGLACVSTSVGGIPDALGDGAGIVVSPGDEEALFGAMDRLAREEGLAAEIGRRAAERCRARYSVTACADQHLALYRELLQ